ncbi:MAG: T9SS type A sorting domain-containing protein [Vicingaceae bacterium]|nr:T9SS type A sorting domain-containing protein [Vicingaceae bacterium]
MNKLVLILFTFLSVTCFGQISHGGSPYSLNKTLRQQVPKHTLTQLNVQNFIAEDIVTDQHKDIPWRFGIERSVSLNLNNSGIWETLPNGDRVWRLEINSPNALSINFNFNAFNIPNGATFFVFNKNQTLGAFTSQNNKANNLFSTSPIKGDFAILEYYEPASVAGQGSIQVNSVIHGYRDFFKQLKAFGSSGNCNVNAICDTSFWDFEIRSAVMLLTAGNTRFCSGALINNVPQDGTPFVLTANHCGAQSNNIFMFNYQSPDCTNNIDGITTQTISGCTVRATDSPSDFALVELSSIPPSTYNVFYAGWSNINTPPTSATGIHHPAGDVKKISHDLNPLIESGYYSAGIDHWEVLDWNSGTTEGGSSGSPLYDQNHRIVGQLHGGDAACNNDDFDFYGKFSYSWDTDPNTTKQLKFWLDPNNTGTPIMNGYDPNGVTLTNDAVLLNISRVPAFVCGDSITPKITIRNHGSATLTSLDVNYELDALGVNQLNWSGSLPSFGVDSIILPTMYIPSGNHTFRAFCTNPNSTTDQNHLNDSANTSFISNANPTFATLYLNTDNFGGETSWLIRDGGGSTYIESPGYASINGGQQITESLCLYDSCFTLVLKDSYGDGFCCAFGSGSIYLVNNFGDTIAQNTTFNSDSLVFPFCISTTGINELTINTFDIYPNPTNGLFTINSDNSKTYNIQIFDVLGNIVYQKPNNNNKTTIDLRTQTKGVYLVSVITENNRVVKRIIIN